VRRPSRSDAIALLLVAGLAVAAAAAMLVLGQVRVPGFVAKVAWSVGRPADEALVGPGRAPLDVAAFRGWFAARVAAGEPFHHVRAVVSEGAAGVNVLLEARARSPWTAARRAADAAAAVEAWDRASAAEQRALDIDALDARADELAASIRTLQVAGATPASDEVAAEVAERDATLRRRAALAAVDPASPASGTLARVGEAPWGIEPRFVRTLVAAAATGAAVALGILLLWSFRPRRAPVGRRHDARSSTAVLATFPGAPHHTAEASRDAGAQLRARLFALTPLVPTRVFLITAHPGVRGKSAVACRLAEALALHGSRTLLVDAALSAPTLADRYLGDPRQVDPAAGRGVASTLSWLEDPEGDHRVATIDVAPRVTFDLVPQTRPIWLAPGTAEAFYGGMALVLERWDGYDAIVIDGPELTPGGDVAWIAAHATGVVLVVEPFAASDPGMTRRAQRRLGAPLLGVVVSDPTPAAMARPKRTLFVA
jgi:Mrp family chromosome partitioning ATPase